MDIDYLLEKKETFEELLQAVYAFADSTCDQLRKTNADIDKYLDEAMNDLN